MFDVSHFSHSSIWRSFALSVCGWAALWHSAEGDASGESAQPVAGPPEPIYEIDENHTSRIPFDSVDDNLSTERATEQRYGVDRYLPLFRKKAIENGIFLPWPYGLTLSGVAFTEQLELDKLSIKLANGEKIDGTAFAEFVKPRDLDVTNYSVRFDAWIFPFLNLYALAGKTEVDLNVKLLGQDTSTFDESRNSYGGGAVLAGGYGVLFAMADIRYTQTDLSLSTDGATTLATLLRVGWNGKLGSANGSIWAGAMRQDIDLTLDVRASEFPQVPPIFAGAEIEVKMSSSKGFTPLVGTRWDISTHWDFSMEYSFGDRDYLSGTLGYRF